MIERQVFASLFLVGYLDYPTFRGSNNKCTFGSTNISTMVKFNLAHDLEITQLKAINKETLLAT